MDEYLRRHFALVDASFCFVAKYRAAPTVRSVLRVANSFGSSQLTRQNLVELAAIAPDLLILELPKTTFQSRSDDVFSPTPVSEEDLEVVTFPLAPQTSQRASTKRKSLFDAALKKNNDVVEGREQTKEHQVSTGNKDSEPASTDPKKTTTSFTPNEQAPFQTDWGSSVLTMLQQMDLYKNQIVHVERCSARQAQYRDLEPLQLCKQVCKALNKCYSIKQLYSHQFEAIEAIRRGENAVLSTATASGKSLAYNVPMLDMLLEDPNATFMYLFPTKALAQDQLKSLRRFLEAADLPLHLGATFDGDTPMKSRSMVIRETRIFLTNPDMLHLTILPQHQQWKKVLSSLSTHVVCCSATIRNPEAHFRQLLPALPRQSMRVDADAEANTEEDMVPPNLDFFRQRPLRVITEDGAPSVEKLFCVWNPEVAKTRSSLQVSSQPADVSKSSSAVLTPRKRKRIEDTASRQNPGEEEQKHEVNSSTSAIYQGSRILARLVEAEVATLLFCRGRKLTELMLMNVHSILKADPKTQNLLRRVSSYRGGYTLEARRRIEQRLFSGDLLGVVATNALELGIDIGELDCTIHLGLPSSIASLWQQAGRAGRRQQQSKQTQSVAVIVCFDAPLDQYFAQKQHAMELFQLEPEAVSLNPMNQRVLGQHLLCAARESALYSSQSGTAYIDSLVFGGLNDNTRITEDDEPAASEVNKVLLPLVKEKKLMKYSEAGGHLSYRVHSCMPKKFRAVSLRSICDENYTVVATSNTAVNDVAGGEVLDEIPGDKAFFQVYPTAVYLHQAQEYLITRLDNIQRTAFAKKCLQPLTYFTTCRDFTDLEVEQTSSHCLTCNRSEKLYGSNSQANYETTSKKRVEDVGTEHVNEFEQRVKPNRVTIFERREGGSGLVPEIVRVLPKLIEKAWTIASECSCPDGCPACIQSSGCSEYNHVLDKQGSLQVLDYLHSVPTI
ncbi:hypothetical protein PC118_g11036 [Phytophthora cactorum]|uniref:P-loop containing nucleoside triphosphate hydrolase n=1 Tax=Phytophthora cactorum TaxID=29920 RepID=A0A8T0Z2K9_9STRA|nr:hypothetical protein PC113_g11775 [Phytophthora cactorum]KAG2980690.1 hypothetical protein PC118_g11036 [Phytophthora cactorum]KAG2986845.1 hypothetical protein PC119_g19804 [Phytophthora cactorum]